MVIDSVRSDPTETSGHQLLVSRRRTKKSFTVMDLRNLRFRCWRNKSLFISTVLLIVLLIADLGSSLRCYSCSSDEHGQCADPFNSTYQWTDDCKPEPTRAWAGTILDASGGHAFQPARRPVCKKVKQREHGQLMYIRSCGHEQWRGQACRPEGDRTFGDNTVAFCETCDTPGCNHASQHVAFTLFVATAALTLVWDALSKLVISN